jgi:chemotaxis protein histidine kinase CheA
VPHPSASARSGGACDEGIAVTSFSTSEKLRQLRERYRASTDHIVEGFRGLALQLATAPDDPEVLELLRRELHRVHGTAGSYGYAEASQLAAALEERAGRWVAAPTLEVGDRAQLVAAFARSLEAAFKA